MSNQSFTKAVRKYQPISADFYKSNRERFMAQMKPNSIAIFYSHDEAFRSGDMTFSPFRQNNDLFYLCGIDQEETILILYPDCPKGEKFREVLLVKHTSEHVKVWEGYKLDQAQATDLSGISNVKWVKDSDALINEMILLADNIYLNTNENDRASFAYATREERNGRAIKEKYYAHEILRSAPMMKKLRMIKQAPELVQIGKAIKATHDAFVRVCGFIKPGVMEYEVEAEISHEFLRQGCSGHAYYPIIAGGGNSCVLHYNDNCRELKDGDIVLMDFGAEYGNYAADLTRVVPVNGKFTPAQKAVYNAVLSVMRGASNLLRPGTTLEKYSKEVGRLMTKELVGLGILSQEDVDKEDYDNSDWPLYKKYFMHGTSHHLGLDVHDLMNRYATFEAGMVFTCEPGIYIPAGSPCDEKYWNIGIRLENDLLINAEGAPTDLMGAIPLEADAIEALMAK